MSQEIFRKLRQMLMEKLDVYRELTDQEILETIDELIGKHSAGIRSEPERKSAASPGTVLFRQEA